MANENSLNRGPIYIGGLIAALVIVYFLYHQGYLSRSGNTTLTPPTASPRLP